MSTYLPVADTTIAPPSAAPDPRYHLKYLAEKVLYEYEIPKDDWLVLMAGAGSADVYATGKLQDEVIYCDRLRSLCLAYIAEHIPERIRAIAMRTVLERPRRNGWADSPEGRHAFCRRVRHGVFHAGYDEIEVPTVISKALGCGSASEWQYWPTDADDAEKRVYHYLKERSMEDPVKKKRSDEMRAVLNPLYDKHGIPCLENPWVVNDYLKAAFEQRDFKALLETPDPKFTVEYIGQTFDAYMTENPVKKPGKNGKKQKVEVPPANTTDQILQEVEGEIKSAAEKAPEFPLDHSSENDESKDAPPDVNLSHSEVAGIPVQPAPEAPPPAASSQAEPAKLSEATKPQDQESLLIAQVRTQAIGLVKAKHPDWDDKRIAERLLKIWGFESSAAAYRAIGNREMIDEVKMALEDEDNPPVDITDAEREEADKNPPPQGIDMPEVPEQKAVSVLPIGTAQLGAPLQLEVVSTTATALASAPAKRSIIRMPSPEEFAQIDTYAKLVSKSGFYPAYNTYEKAMVVMLKGYSLGIDPMSAVDGIDPIETTDRNTGQKRISMNYRAKLLKALCERTGQVEKFQVVADERKAVAYVKRKGHSEATYTYTMEDAEKAQLTGRAIWQKFPKNMLSNRVISLAADREFPDVRYVFTMIEDDD